MSDERTPADLRREVLRARREREEAIRRELETPPEYAHERDSEPSYRMALSEPGQRLSVEGDDPAALAELVERVRHRPTIIESLAPLTKRMSSPRGKLVAILTGGAALLGAAVRTIAWLQENGFLD